MSEPVILGSESPSADVLVYDKNRKYFTGVLQIDVGGTLYDLEINPDGVNNEKVTYEFVNEV